MGGKVMKYTTDEEVKDLQDSFAELYDFASENLNFDENMKFVNIYADLFWQDLENAKKNLKAMVKELGL
jgi:hypothetical protein